VLFRIDEMIVQIGKRAPTRATEKLGMKVRGPRGDAATGRDQEGRVTEKPGGAGLYKPFGPKTQVTVTLACPAEFVVDSGDDSEQSYLAGNGVQITVAPGTGVCVLSRANTVTVKV